MSYARIATKADAAATHAAVALGFSVPISVALDNVLLAFVLLGWLLGARYREKFTVIFRNPVALLALALFALLAIGTLYGSAEPKEAWRYLNKHTDLIYLALLIPLFGEAKMRERALYGFMLAMILSLAWSYVIALGWAPESWLDGRAPGEAAAFKHRITHNLLMAFAAFLFALQARGSVSPRVRAAFILLALLAVYNVVFMVGGRSGYVVLAALLAYFFFDWLRWKGLVAFALAGLLVGVAAFYVSEEFRTRVVQGMEGYNAWDAGVTEANSVGIRMDFYRNTLHIIEEQPLTGVGTGGFERAYSAHVAGTAMLPTSNPHNQYLLVTAQVGVGGLVLLLALFATQWHLSARLPNEWERHVARGLLLTIMLGSLFNSLLLDHSEGLLYGWASGVLFAGLPSRREAVG